MKVNLLFPAIGLFLLLFSACTAPAGPVQPDLDQVRAELQAMEDAYAAAHNARDAEAIMAYYADDAVSLPDGEPPIVGKAAILEDTKSEMQDTSGATIAFEVVDVWAAGDIAVEVGKSTVTLPDGSTHTGKYVSVFEKRDGKYICVRDIWNKDTDDDDDDDDDDDEEKGEESEG